MTPTPDEPSPEPDVARPGTGPEACFADFTKPGLLIPRLKHRDKEGAIGELAEAMEREGCVPSGGSFLRTVLAREGMMNTAWESGIAFPHARLAGIPRPWFALGTAAVPVAWSEDGPSVRLIFLMAVSDADTQYYLSLLSGLARLCREPRRIALLKEARDAAALLEQLRGIPLNRIPANTV